MTLFSEDPITGTPTAMGLFMTVVLAFYGVFIVSLFVPYFDAFFDVAPEAYVLFGASGLLIPMTFLVFKELRLKGHFSAVKAYAAAHQYEFYEKGQSNLIAVPLSSVSNIHDARDQVILNAVKGEDWVYYDYAYSVYRHARNGDYKARTIYYAIMATKLPRQLPHVFFDSFQARKRQFRFEFARSQIYSFEGDFDKYFVSYMPDDYKVDTLSFISPEVMLALRDAAAYDIEIVDDNILLLGALGAPDTQLSDMVAKLAAIKRALADNAAVYRDEHLPGALGRHMVANAGQQLKSSQLWYALSVAVPAAFILYIIFSLAQNIVETSQHITSP